MVLFNFSIRYLLENTLMIEGVFAFEYLNYSEASRRNLATASDLAQLIIGALIIGALEIFLFAIYSLAFCRFKKIKSESHLFVLKADLNERRRLNWFVYNTNFFLMRLLVCLFIALTPNVKGTTLWIIVSIV